MTAALRCTGLLKRFDDVTAVNGVDLTVNEGECFGMLGPNGAGKTTTIEILEGLTLHDEGTVEVFGKAWGSGNDDVIRQKLGIALQETELSEKLTVEETVRLFRSFYPQGRAIDDVLRGLQLDEKRHARVGKLSGGQRQRTALACALVGDPAVLFLDEPTTGLDPQARIQVWDLVQDFRRSGGTVVVTTHYMEEAARLCDRIAVLDHGKVIALGTPDELIASLGRGEVVELELPEDRAEGEMDGVRALAGVEDVTRRAGALILRVDNVASTLPRILAHLVMRQCPASRILTRRATLDDVFVALTGRALRE